MKERFYRITGLNEGQPIEPYGIDAQHESLDHHLIEDGDKSRHADPISREEFEALDNHDTAMTKTLFIEVLLTFFTLDDFKDRKYYYVSDSHWTLADMILKQFLNNGKDGFGIKNIHDAFEFVDEHKSELIELNMLSLQGYNKAGFELWDFS